jgi:hypothetical protein
MMLEYVEHVLTRWDDEFPVEADLARTDAPIYLDGDPTPFQTADAKHRVDGVLDLPDGWMADAGDGNGPHPGATIELKPSDGDDDDGADHDPENEDGDA